MDNFRRWIKGRPSAAPAPREVAPPSTTGLSRTGRAGHVTQMQADVSRLQQEILALSNDSAGETTQGGDPRMSGLEQELDKAQRELARYQARV